MLEKNKTKQGLEFVKRFKHIKMVKMIPKLDLYLCVCVHGTCVHGTWYMCTCVHIHVYMCVYMYVYMFVHGKNGKKELRLKNMMKLHFKLYLSKHGI